MKVVDKKEKQNKTKNKNKSSECSHTQTTYHDNLLTTTFYSYQSNISEHV